MLGIFFNGYVFSLFACNLILICKKQEKLKEIVEMPRVLFFVQLIVEYSLPSYFVQLILYTVQETSISSVAAVVATEEGRSFFNFLLFSSFMKHFSGSNY